MRIDRFTAWHVVIPLKRTIRHASHSRRSTDNFVVRCELSDGTIGWGESVPRSYVTGETIDTVMEQFLQADLAAAFGGTYSGMDDVINRLGSWHPESSAPSKRDCFGNCLKCAIELSALDAVGRNSGRSLASMIPLIPDVHPILKPSTQVRYSTAITTMKPRKQIVQAMLMRAWGFQQMKLKVGADGIDDRLMLRRVRRIVGQKMDLRVDANEAWAPDEVESRMEPLLEYKLSSLEQPVPHANVEDLAAIRKNMPVPIMLDESLCSASDAVRAIEQSTCDLFNIRISKCGGIVNSVRLAAIAQKAGLGYQLGCQVGESGILSAAGRHLACSIDGVRFLEGSFDRFLVRERLTKQDLTFGYGGKANAIDGAGLGIDVDPSAVERISQRTESISLS